MKKQTLTGLALVGITGIGSAIAAIMINKMDRKQLNKAEIKEEVKEETNEEINRENNDEHKDEQTNIDDSDIDV